MHLVFADANVLYLRTLRGWTFLLREESGSMYSVVSSRDAVTEAMAGLRKKYPTVSGDQLSKIQDRIERSLDDLIASFPGGSVEGIADPGDFHIYNAAVHAGVNILLTQNVKDFAKVTSPPFDLYSADEFFMLTARNSPEAVKRTVLRQLNYWQKKSENRKSAKGLAQALVEAGAPEFGAHIKQVLMKLSGVGMQTSNDSPS